jgi:hypothetical protein
MAPYVECSNWRIDYGENIIKSKRHFGFKYQVVNEKKFACSRFSKFVLDAAYKGSLRGQVGIHFGEYPLR